jgi:hypothetical protein
MENLSALDPRPFLTGRWEVGGSGVEFWLGGADTVTPITGKCPAESGSRKVSLVIGRQQGRAGEFVTVLSPYRVTPNLAVARHSNEITIRRPSTVEVLTIPADGGRPSLQREASAGATTR